MLKPVLTSLGNAKDAGSITLKDATGAYDVALNPGGYGAPNLAPPPAVIGMTWRYWSDDLNYANKIYTDAGFIADLIAGGRTLKTQDLGLAADGKFQSGIHQVKYYPYETTNCAITLIQDSQEDHGHCRKPTIHLFTKLCGCADPRWYG
jgi:hypothetical protein